MIYDYPKMNYGYPKISLYLWISIIHFGYPYIDLWISNIQLINGYPKMIYGYPKIIYGYP